jgi:hypothetical protein
VSIGGVYITFLTVKIFETSIFDLRNFRVKLALELDYGYEDSSNFLARLFCDNFEPFFFFSFLNLAVWLTVRWRWERSNSSVVMHFQSLWSLLGEIVNLNFNSTISWTSGLKIFHELRL